jgi:hypothetical protein
LQKKKTTFYNDSSEGTCGVVDKNEVRTRKGDFFINILSFVEAGENTGYFCTIKRQMDGLERFVFCICLLVLGRRGGAHTRHSYFP